jgi:predicted HTH transcriptional regulator
MLFISIDRKYLLLTVSKRRNEPVPQCMARINRAEVSFPGLCGGL